MHYRNALGTSVEIDIAPSGEYVLAGREPIVLKPSEVVASYQLVEDRRDPTRGERRRDEYRWKIGRRHREHTSAAQDAALAISREKVRVSGELRVTWRAGWNQAA